MNIFKHKTKKTKTGKSPQQILKDLGFNNTQEVAKAATQLTAKTTVNIAEKTLGVKLG